jgi:hypothetical protein
MLCLAYTKYLTKRESGDKHGKRNSYRQAQRN